MLTFNQTDGGRGQTAPEEDFDCTVRAAARALNISYQQAHDKFTQLGRQPGKAFPFSKFADSIGMQNKWDGRQTVSQFVRTHRKGSFIVRTRSAGKTIGHVFALVNGVIYDNKLPRPRQLVRSYWEVAQSGAA